jgi:low affinity Fe/Cu permease
MMLGAKWLVKLTMHAKVDEDLRKTSTNEVASNQLCQVGITKKQKHQTGNCGLSNIEQSMRANTERVIYIFDEIKRMVSSSERKLGPRAAQLRTCSWLRCSA